MVIKTSASLTLKCFQLSSDLALAIPSVFSFNASLFLLFLLHIVITYIVLIYNWGIDDPKGASRSSPSITLVHAEHKSFLPFPPSLHLSKQTNKQKKTKQEFSFLWQFKWGISRWNLCCFCWLGIDYFTSVFVSWVLAGAHLLMCWFLQCSILAMCVSHSCLQRLCGLTLVAMVIGRCWDPWHSRKGYCGPPKK